MKFKRASLETCGIATGTIVVIDVLRAFSTAAYAFAAGVQTIALVSTVEEAFALKKQKPAAFIMGEVDGAPVAGFDFSNSPTAFDKLDLTDGFMIQRTSAGTQGVIRSRQADHLFTSSFCCARATARHICEQAPEAVTFVITGLLGDGRGDEDMACADYLEALLRGEKPDSAPFIQRVYASPAAQLFIDPARPEFPETDLEYCVQVDRFDFAMCVQRRNGLLLMEAVS
jgi:2-phosphosulfolactate phosphatase